MRSKTKRPKVRQKLRVRGKRRESSVCRECAICAEERDHRAFATLPCGHSLCSMCLIKHSRVSDACPFCRAAMTNAPARAKPRSEMTAALLAQIATNEIEQALHRPRQMNPRPRANTAFEAQLMRECLKECAMGVAAHLISWYEGS